MGSRELSVGAGGWRCPGGASGAPWPLATPNGTVRTYSGAGGTSRTSSALVSRRTLWKERGWAAAAGSAPAKPSGGLGGPSVAAETPKEPHPAAGLSAEIPKPTYGGAGKTLQSGEAAVALQPSLSSLSSLTFVTARPLGTLGVGKGPRQARGGRPLPKAPRTPCFTHGTCQRAQHHSPACLERLQDRRDPWALVHPAGRKEGVKRSRDGGRAKRCQHPETPTASGPGLGGSGGRRNQPQAPHSCSQPCWHL